MYCDSTDAYTRLFREASQNPSLYHMNVLAHLNVKAPGTKTSRCSCTSIIHTTHDKVQELYQRDLRAFGHTFEITIDRFSSLTYCLIV
jgi:hypothetical protein